MTLSLYDISIPIFIRAFHNMSKNLEKGRAFALKSGIDESDLLAARLYADMLPLVGQVQRASDTAKFVAVRVGGLQAPPMPDNEKTFDDLQSRIGATVAYLKTIPADAFDGREGVEVPMKFGKLEHTFTARDYLLAFAVPNFYFHATTAYAILRHKGVPLGKVDFIAAS